jgi:hypothetical protein
MGRVYMKQTINILTNHTDLDTSSLDYGSAMAWWVVDWSMGQARSVRAKGKNPRPSLI